jgi:hypothetical protein
MKIPFVSKRSHRSSEATGLSNPPPAAPPQQQPPPSPAMSAAAAVTGEVDLISQEEEYQMQLAMALSASASASSGGGVGDRDGDQIRKAKLMSLRRGDLGCAAGDRVGEDTGEPLSRRYRVSLLIFLLFAICCNSFTFVLWIIYWVVSKTIPVFCCWI